jgi:transcriptional regulator with XRE-family HTH domain
MSDARAARAGSSARSAAPADLADGIGRRVAAHRERRGLRVAEFARQIGVSPSLISQIERGQARPSVSTLFAMAQALDVPVDAFFRERQERREPEPGDLAGHGHRSEPGDDAGEAAEGEQRYVVRRGSRAAIDIEGGVRWERLTPRTLPHLDFMQLVYGPGAQSNPGLYTHPGTEMVLVTTGILDISVGFERYRLEAGDSMHFPSSMPHQYVNPTGETTRAVTVILYDCPGDSGTTGSST